MVTVLRSPHFSDVVQIEVGAMIVGTIDQTYRPGKVKRGQEKGTFRFGGSTIIVLLEPGRVDWDEDLVQSSREEMETLLLYGAKMGQRKR